MVDAAERRLKRVGNHAKVAHRQVAFVELAFSQALRDDAVHEFAYPLVRAVAARADDGLDGIRQHDDRSLAALRPGPGVAELLGISRRIVGAGFAIEVSHEARTVVLGNKGSHARGQAVTTGQLEADADMFGDEAGTDVRLKLVVRVRGVDLVLD